LGRKILAGEVPDHGTVNIDAGKDGLVFQVSAVAERKEATQDLA